MIGRMKFDIDALVDEILDRLPKEVWTSSTTTFLDLAIGGGQFVRSIEARLRKAGHAEDNISKRVFGFENSKLNIRYAVNKYGLVGQYSRVSYDQLFEKGIDMKFDVVVGNPPYNPPTASDRGGSGSGNKIWQKFIEVAFDHLKNGGIVAMVTPNNWRTGKFTKGLHRKAQETIFENNIISWKNANHYFDGIGTEIDYWIVKNEKSNLSKIIKDNAFLPSVNDEKQIKIIEEWLNSLKNECYLQNVGANDSRRFNRTRGVSSIDNTHIHAHVISGSKTKQGIFDWYDVKTTGFDKKKVIIFDSSGPFPIYDRDGKLGCGHHADGYEVLNDQEAKDIIEFFDSKLCNFVIKVVSNKLKDFRCPVQLFKRIPKNWRELEEKHFG